MNRPRVMLAAALAIVLLAPVGCPVRAETAFQPTGAVTFKVDHDKKTITVTVNLAFYNRSCGPAVSCETPAADVGRIVKAIEDMWNTGQKVKCYTFSVKVNARTVGSQSEAGQSEVDIGLDYGPVPVKAFVRGALNVATVSDPLSNSPDERIDAVHDPDAPTTWPSKTYDQTYAHEFGHILGLDDNYDKTNAGQLYPGGSEDLMFRKQGDVTGEMVKRVVERSGQVDLKDLKCGWNYKDATPLGDITGLKCDTAWGEWTLQGEQNIGGGTLTTLWNVTIAEMTLTGTYKYEAIQKLGPTLTTGNSTAKAAIVMNPDGSVTMTLDPAVVNAKVTVPGQTARSQLSAMGWTYDWLPETGGACP